MSERIARPPQISAMMSVTRKERGKRKIPTDPVNSKPPIVKNGITFVPIRLAATIDPTKMVERYVNAVVPAPPGCAIRIMISDTTRFSGPGASGPPLDGGGGSRDHRSDARSHRRHRPDLRGTLFDIRPSHDPNLPGAIAWIVSLNTFPYLAVPAYWIFGRTRFNGYVQSRKEVDARLHDRVGPLRESLERWRSSFPDEMGRLVSAEKLAKLPFTTGNEVQLLVNGPEAFESMFEAIARAKRYVLIQFYIVRSDRFGEELKELLLATAARGVAVRFLYDEIGSYALSARYLRELRAGGVEIHPFSSTRGQRNRFQINFRNHRKVLVVDGLEGYLGGLNVGEEYLGLSERFGMWRDTHVRIAGPALVGLQLPFAEDWHWATGEYLDLDWQGCTADGEFSVGHRSSTALVFPSGPADQYATASLMIQHAIHAASHRLWIASPYFVPDEAVQDAPRSGGAPGRGRPNSHPRSAGPSPRLPLGVRLSRFDDLFGSSRLSVSAGVPAPEGLPGGRTGSGSRHGQPRQPLISPQLRNHRDRRGYGICS
jgi:hypothetical protein